MRKSLVSMAAVVLAMALMGCGNGTAPLEPLAVLDSAPPQAPLGLRQSLDSVSDPVLQWDANAEADLGGYQIYMYSPDPSRDNAYVLAATVNASTTSWKFPVVDESSCLSGPPAMGDYLGGVRLPRFPPFGEGPDAYPNVINDWD